MFEFINNYCLNSVVKKNDQELTLLNTDIVSDKDLEKYIVNLGASIKREDK